ncbi:MAG: hypothetical protein QNJ02_09660 [Desulfobacterales bacterium]|nr:hypothetical protein [Desulfobacterales bacterium]MDJ0875527.1 hypothetical protein [Desulfobacterales bacterium]
MKSTPGENSMVPSGGGAFLDGTESFDGEIPWASAATWRECQLNLQTTIGASRKNLGPAADLAGRILHRYSLAGDLFDALAGITCEVCPRPCCLDARVWLDFKDLLLIHLSGQEPPPGQLRQSWWSRCRYLTSHGCTLPRPARPWVCTWYICPDQRRALKRDIPGGPGYLSRWWSEIALLRDRVETSFFAATRR